MNQNINTPQDNCGQIQIFNELFTQTPQAEHLKLLPYKKQKGSREVIRYGERNHHVGLFSSRVNRALIPYESSLERDACVYFESRKEIQSYSSQPLAISLNINEKCRTVYPDFLIKTINADAYIDIKFSKKTKNSNFIARTEALFSYCSSRGMGYTVMTENEIRTPALDTIRWLTSIARGIPHDYLVDTVWYWLSVVPDKTLISDVWKILANYPSVKSVIAGFILDGHIIVDLNRPINSQYIIQYKKTIEANNNV